MRHPAPAVQAPGTQRICPDPRLNPLTHPLPALQQCCAQHQASLTQQPAVVQQSRPDLHPKPLTAPVLMCMCPQDGTLIHRLTLLPHRAQLSQPGQCQRLQHAQWSHSSPMAHQLQPLPQLTHGLCQNSPQPRKPVPLVGLQMLKPHTYSHQVPQMPLLQLQALLQRLRQPLQWSHPVLASLRRQHHQRLALRRVLVASHGHHREVCDRQASPATRILLVSEDNVPMRQHVHKPHATSSRLRRHLRRLRRITAQQQRRRCGESLWRGAKPHQEESQMSIVPRPQVSRLRHRRRTEREVVLMSLLNGGEVLREIAAQPAPPHQWQEGPVPLQLLLRLEKQLQLKMMDDHGGSGCTPVAG